MTSAGARAVGFLMLFLATGFCGCGNRVYATREEQSQYDMWRGWIKALDDPKQNRHAEAPMFLGDYRSFPLVRDRSEAVAPLVRAMTGDETPAFRASAAGALGAIGSADTVPSLVRAAGDREPAVRAAAAAALGDLLWRLQGYSSYKPIGGAAPVLVQRLKDDAPAVRAQAAKALGKIQYHDAKKDVAALLKDTDADVRREAAEALAIIDPPAESWPVLADLVQNDRMDVRIAAAHAMQFAGGYPQTADLLCQAAKDADAGLRAMAVQSLGYVRGDPSLDAVLDALDDPQESVRAAAVEAACRYDNLAAEPLVRRLAKSMPARPEPHFRVLARIRGATPPVMALLKSSDLDTQRIGIRLIAFACHSGVEGETQPVVERLAAILKDAPDDLRASAAAALGHLNDAAAGAPLAACLQRDPQPAVRAAAALAIGSLLHDVRQTYNIQHHGLRPANEKGPDLPGLDALKTALKDKDAAVRIAALRGLAVAGIMPEESTLRPMLEDPETSVRLEAARRISEPLYNIYSYKLIQACLANDRWEVRQEIARFLGEIGSPLAVDRVRDPAEHPEVRIAAIRALTKAALAQVPAMAKPEDRGRLVLALDVITRDVGQPPAVRAAAEEAYHKLYAPPVPA
jgi:HEAT repeat protein